jgi:hypothetical protein
MNIIDELANEIVENIIKDIPYNNRKWLAEKIAAYADERVKEAVKEHHENKAHVEEPFRCANCFNDGIEEAAKTADFTAEAVKENHVWEPSNLATNIARSIRGLRK